MKKILILTYMLIIPAISLTSYGQMSGFKQYLDSKIESSQLYISGNKYQKDFLLFMSMLYKCHPSFVDGSDGVIKVEELETVGYEWTATCSSTEDLWCYLQSIASLLQDGHTTLMPDINMNLIYPITYFIDRNQMYVMGINEEHKSFLGKQIKLINGDSLNNVMQHFQKLISSDNETYFEDKVTDFMPLYSMWRYTPYVSQDSSLHITFTDETKLSIKPVGKTQIRLHWITSKSLNNSIRSNNKMPFHYTILPDRDLCYLQFNSCVDQSSLRLQYIATNPNMSLDEIDKFVSKLPRFDNFLNEMFDTIREKKIKTLVIDIRNNKGGNSKLCDVLLSWLKPLKDIKPIDSYTRVSDFWKLCYPKLAVELETGFAKKQKFLEAGNLYNNHTLSSLLTDSEFTQQSEDCFVMNHNDDEIFDGTVFFIQNSKTYSSAGMLVTTASDNNIGIIIGEQSSYRPCSYGDVLTWVLPNTNIKGSVSHKVFNRPILSKCNEKHLVPSVQLSPTWTDVLNNKDIYWEWILDSIK